jgi:hypothetical protein
MRFFSPHALKSFALIGEDLKSWFIFSPIDHPGQEVGPGEF